MQYASQNLIPVTLELGGKSPNIFFKDVIAEDDDFFDKAIEGFVMFAFNQGEVCTCPSRALIQESDLRPIHGAGARAGRGDRAGRSARPATMIGAQASSEQLEKILSYIDIGKQEGAKVLTGGERNQLAGELAGGYYVKPTVFKGHNKMRVFQEEIFGPVVSVTTFKTDDEALAIANDTLYGLGAGIWSRDMNRLYRFGRAIQAGRVWTNCYHAYPAHAAFGGYKQSGIGREKPQDDAGPLPADQEHAGQLQPEEARVLLIMLDKVTATPAALGLLAEIIADHGPVLFHQSGGCCDGSSPMCYPRGDFLIGDRDVLLGVIGGDTPVYISASQYEAWKHTDLIIDVVPGRGGMFSLDNGRERRFLTRSTICTPEQP